MDIHKNQYPRLEVDLNKLASNARHVVSMCSQAGIEVTGVIKGCNAIPQVGKAMLKGGCTGLASSRLDQIERIRKMDQDVPIWLLRIPMISELERMVDLVTISLNSESVTVNAIQSVCASKGIRHGVVLMADLGDLREGFRDFDDLIELAVEIESKMPNVVLEGIGTNLGCYGSICPSNANLGLLVQLAQKIELRIGRKLKYISGGATTSLPLLIKGGMPRCINHLRIGEAILNGRDLPRFWGIPIPGVVEDAFVLKAELVEVKEKPSYPIGEIFVDAFGEVPVYSDVGNRIRAIAAVGKLDIGSHDKLSARQAGVILVGSSSDHLILDVTDMEKRPSVGDVLSFNVFYAAMLYLTGSDSVIKQLLNEDPLNF